MIRALAKTHGGKSYLCRRIIARMPRGCDAFYDLFGGGGVMTLNAPFPVRAYNDFDFFKAMFLEVVRDRPSPLSKRLARVEYCEADFAESKLLNESHRASLDRAALADDWRGKLDRAVHWYVRNKMSRGGLGRDFAWSDRLRGGRPGDLNAWLNAIKRIPLVSTALQGVRITPWHFRDALRWMPQYPRVCIYADPPYVHSTRSVPSAYEIEMSDDDHMELLSLLTFRAKQGHAVMISGYANPMYSALLRGWRRIRFSMPNHAGQGKSKQRRTEILWLSPGMGI